MGVVVRRCIDILILLPTSLVIRSFFAAASLHICSFLKCFSFLQYDEIKLIFIFYSLVPQY